MDLEFFAVDSDESLACTHTHTHTHTHTQSNREIWAINTLPGKRNARAEPVV